MKKIVLTFSLIMASVAQANASAFASDALDIEFGAVSESGLSVAAVPKKVSGTTPAQFFVRATAE